MKALGPSRDSTHVIFSKATLVQFGFRWLIMTGKSFNYMHSNHFLSVKSSLPFYVKIADLYFVIVRLDAVETFLLVLLLIQISLIPMNLTFTSAVMLEYRSAVCVLVRVRVRENLKSSLECL